MNSQPGGRRKEEGGRRKEEEGDEGGWEKTGKRVEEQREKEEEKEVSLRCYLYCIMCMCSEEDWKVEISTCMNTQATVVFTYKSHFQFLGESAVGTPLSYC